MAAVGATVALLTVMAIGVICPGSFYRDQRQSIKARKDKKAAKKRHQTDEESGDSLLCPSSLPGQTGKDLVPLHISKPEPAPHPHPMI